MPLIKGKSEKSFSKNVETEMNAGKPQKQSLAIAYAMKKKAKKMAEGGLMTHDGYQSTCTEHCESPCMIHEQASGYEEPMMAEGGELDVGEKDSDKGTNEGVLSDMLGISHAEGGRIEPMENEESDDHELDMVGRIMKMREHMYSEGGKVANDTKIEAGFEPNDFDDLALRDDLESSYTGANSGDELGDEREDMDRKDIVSRIMKSRAKKDRLPRPA